jgi:cysteine desulfurase
MVYLDHNSTTPLRPEVRTRLLELLDQGPGNASGTHSSGRQARAVIDDARESIAASLGVPEQWIIFTSGGTEANNHALRGPLQGHPHGALAVGSTEHPSVLLTAEDLQKAGHPLHLINVDECGQVDQRHLRKVLREGNLLLLSCMLANNECGALLPAKEVAEALAECGKDRPLWHVDGVQALGKLPLALREWGVDLASFSAHKIGGPQGVGFLVRRSTVQIPALIQGGGQEYGARSGTENVAGIGAMALAVEMAVQEQPAFQENLQDLAQELWKGVQGETPAVRLLGPPINKARLPNTLNLLFPGVDGRALVARLDLEGLEASLGSACSSGGLEPSHVLLAMGCTPSEARAGLRISLGQTTTHKDIHSTVETLGKVTQSMMASR